MLEGNYILEKAIYRTAVKKFDQNVKIKEIDFKYLLEIARFSPTSFGLEPWKIIVVQDMKLRDKLAHYSSGAVQQLATASHFILISVITDLNYDSKYFQYILREIRKVSEDDYNIFKERLLLFQKEKLNLVNFREYLDWAAKQAYIVLGNMLLASALMGIDSCPIEGFLPLEVEKVLEDCKVLDPKKEKIVVMAAFGYRSESVDKPKHRRPLNEIVKYY